MFTDMVKRLKLTPFQVITFLSQVLLERVPHLQNIREFGTFIVGKVFSGISHLK